MDFFISVLKKYYAFCLFPLRLLIRIVSPSNLEKTAKETSESKQFCCSNDKSEFNKYSSSLAEEEKIQEQVKSDSLEEVDHQDDEMIEYKLDDGTIKKIKKSHAAMLPQTHPAKIAFDEAN